MVYYPGQSLMAIVLSRMCRVSNLHPLNPFDRKCLKNMFTYSCWQFHRTPNVPPHHLKRSSKFSSRSPGLDLMIWSETEKPQQLPKQLHLVVVSTNPAAFATPQGHHFGESKLQSPANFRNGRKVGSFQKCKTPDQSLQKCS